MAGLRTTEDGLTQETKPGSLSSRPRSHEGCFVVEVLAQLEATVGRGVSAVL